MIWYSHINEDSSIERELLSQGDYKTVACVCGSGERFIALLDHPAKDFYAIDINPEALMLLELKLKALENLSIMEYLAFTGHSEISPIERLEMYDNISGSLNSESKRYWDTKRRAISKGILNAGHFESYLSSLRPILKLFLGNGFNRVFQTGKSVSDDFPSIRWKLLNILFSKRWVYSITGNRDPSFIGSNARNEKIGKGLNAILEHGEARDAYVFHLIFNGSLKFMPHHALPASLQPEVLSIIRERLRTGDMRIHFINKDYREAVTALGLNRMDNVFHSLSDIIGFENEHYLKSLLDKILSGEENMAVARSFLVNNIDTTFFERADISSCRWKDYSEAESTHMYQVLAIKS